MFNREEMKELTGAATNEYFRGFLPHMVHIMRLSRKRKNWEDPIKSWTLQLALLKLLEEAEIEVTKGTQEYKKSGDESYRIQALQNKLISKVYREIADGMAWRALRHNRINLRILSQSQSPGFTASPGDLSKTGRIREKQFAENAIRNGGYVFLNDITNWLRVGDLTLIRDEGRSLYISEVKNKGDIHTPKSISEKMDLNKKLTDQDFRLIQAQLAIDSRQIKSYDPNHQIHELNIPPATFLPQVKRLLGIAGKRGYASGFVADYLFVEATYPLIFKDDLEAFKKAVGEGPPPGERLGVYMNYNSISVNMSGEVTRAKAPYSVYPFTPEQRVDLMTGQVMLAAHLYGEPLNAAFARLGWSMEIVLGDESAKDKYPLSGPILFPNVRDKNYIQFSKGKFSSHMGVDALAKIGYEFISVEGIVDLLEHTVKMARERGAKSGTGGIDNIGEAQIWD